MRGRYLSHAPTTGQEWDHANRLTTVRYGSTSSTPDTYTFAYDADGGRTMQVAPNGDKTAYAGGGLYEETPSLAAMATENFSTDPATRWVPQAGSSWTWGTLGVYTQTATGNERVSLYQPSTTSFADVQVVAKVRLGNQTNALGGILLRRNATGSAAYFVGVRNTNSTQGCGIFEKDPTTGLWTNQTPTATLCEVPALQLKTIEARVIGGRIELLVEGTLAASWVDSTPLPAGDAGLATWSTATTRFDDFALYGVTSRSYYGFGGARVAERTTSADYTADLGVVYNLHGDHLGSVSIATSTAGVAVGTRTYYYPFGDVRQQGVGSPTDFGFAGQRGTSSIKLIQMGVRWYSPMLGRWASADTIIPSLLNSQSLNRYAYAYNNPLKYIDPSGYDPLDQAWRDSFYNRHHRDPNEFDIQIRLFSLAYPDEYEWSKFYNEDGTLRMDSSAAKSESVRRIFKDRSAPGRSWAGLLAALTRLAAFYSSSETEAFVRDVGTLFAGLKSRIAEPDMWTAYSDVRSNRDWVKLRDEGLWDQLAAGYDSDGNVHHWAWALGIGYLKGRVTGTIINTGREINDQVNMFSRIHARDPLASGVVLCPGCSASGEGNILGKAIGNTWADPTIRSDVWLGNRGVAMGDALRSYGLSGLTVAYGQLSGWPN